MELHIRGLLVQLCSHWRRFIGGLSAAVFAAVLLAAPALAAGTLELNASQGAAGDELLISGQGFEASEQVKLKWDGSPVGPPIRADANGEFTAIRSIPIDALPGKHTVSAAGLQSGVTAEALIEVIDPAATTTTTSPATTTTITSSVATTTITSSAATTNTTSSAATTNTTSSAATTNTTSLAAEEKATTSLNTATAADGNTTTSSGTATDIDGSPAVDELRTAPTEATPGPPVEIAGVAANDISAGPGVESVVDSNLGSALATPIGLASAVGMPLLVVITVWWMYRKPTNDEQESME